MLSPTCQVIRDSNDQVIDVSGLVPGDLVRLAPGVRVPADLRMIDTLNLKIDESALTGESFAVAKRSDPDDTEAHLGDRRCMAWAGTAVVNGRGLGLVVETGMDTEFGRIAGLTGTIRWETTPLQDKLATLGKQLGLIALGISVLVAASGWIAGQGALEMFMTGVSLAVAVVPEGLPAVVTLTMALGIRAMVRRKALVRRLQAAEGLGAATVICTDKTGTLTTNQMTVQQIWLPSGTIDVTGTGYDPAGHFESDGKKLDYHNRKDLLNLLSAGLHCNHAKLVKTFDRWTPAGEPTESALVVAAYKAWLEPPPSSARLTEFSFNSDRKRMTVVERGDQEMIVFSKGAPEVLLERCSQLNDGTMQRDMTDADRESVHQAYTAMAKRGLRTLALATRTLPFKSSLDEDHVENNLTLLGIVGMIDPARPEVPDAVRLAQAAGIRVVMITGDSTLTALAVAKSIGLRASRAIDGRELEAMADDALADALRHDTVFARTTPEHKLRIVNILQSQNEVVAMTGDGVNDAPALKKADVGVAMGNRGTDVAKGAADIILTDDNFNSIVGAVEEGRRQYDNIQKFVRYLLSSNTGEVVAIFINILIGGPLILLPVQILWMNLVTDGLTAVALGVEPAEKTLMQRPPRSPNEPLLNMTGIGIVLLLGSYIGLISLWVFHHYLSSGDARSIAVAQTVAFTAIIMIEKVNVLNFRSLQTPLSKIGWFSNPWVLLAIFATIALQVAAIYLPVLQKALHTVPLVWSDWLLIVAIALPIFFLAETVKQIRRMMSKQTLEFSSQNR